MLDSFKRALSEVSWRVACWMVRKTHSRSLISGLEVFYESDEVRRLTTAAIDLLDSPSLALVRRHLRRLVELPTAEVRISPRVGLVALNSREWHRDERLWAVGLVWMAAVVRAARSGASLERRKAIYRWGMRAAAHLHLSDVDQEKMAQFLATLNAGRYSTIDVM